MLVPSCSYLQQTPLLQLFVVGCPKRLRTDRTKSQTTCCSCRESGHEANAGMPTHVVHFCAAVCKTDTRSFHQNLFCVQCCPEGSCCVLFWCYRHQEWAPPSQIQRRCQHLLMGCHHWLISNKVSLLSWKERQNKLLNRL